LVKDYDAAGRVNWNAVQYYRCGELNTYYQDGQADDAFFGANNNEFADKSDPNRECDIDREMIIFTNPDGSNYRIKKNCGNPIGQLKPLQSLAVPWTLTPNSSGPTTSAGTYNGKPVL